MADMKINITEKDTWLGTDTILQCINPDEDKTLAPQAELLAKEGTARAKAQVLWSPLDLNDSLMPNHLQKFPLECRGLHF